MTPIPARGERKDRPILFSGEMVRAILAGRKTVTRRVVKPQPELRARRRGDGPGGWWWKTAHVEMNNWTDPTKFAAEVAKECPYGQPGDRLWVRETWADTNGESGPMISYKAGGDRFLVDESYPVEYSRYPGCDFAMWCGDLRRGCEGHAWRPPLSMPRWASRLTLEVTGVRVERVQEISAQDCFSEGISVGAIGPTREACDRVRIDAFREIWDSLNAKRGFGWDKNPWVWVVEFKTFPSSPNR